MAEPFVLANDRSDMIEKFEFLGMGIQVDLCVQIRLIVFTHIMVEQGNGNDEGNQAVTIILYFLKNFRFFIRTQLFFEIAENMLQHIDLFFLCGF